VIVSASDDVGTAKHLMMVRSEFSKFMPRALVFPGGAQDEADGERFKDMKASGMLARRQCALRELAEETGIILTASKSADSDHPWMLADGWLDAESGDASGLAFDAFGGVSSSHEALAAAASRAMPCIDRFRTPKFEAASFDAWFYAIALSSAGSDGRSIAECRSRSEASGLTTVTADDLATGADEALNHSKEGAAMVWLSAAEALALHEQGRAILPPPQWMMLSQMCGRGPDRRLWPGLSLGGSREERGPEHRAGLNADALGQCGNEESASLYQQVKDTTVAQGLPAPGGMLSADECDWRPYTRVQLIETESGGYALVLPGDEAYTGTAYDATSDGDIWHRGDGAGAVQWPGESARPGARNRVIITLRDPSNAAMSALLADRRAAQLGDVSKRGSLPFASFLYSAESE
jgi:8-oxo-dGTP pyrophosphatase MutT (NUDIX family)